MNIDIHEEQVIRHFEGELTAQESQALMDAMVTDDQLASIYAEYQILYGSMESVSPMEAPSDLRSRFDAFIEQETQAATQESTSTIRNLFTWRTTLGIAASFLLIFTIWNNYDQQQRMNAQFANLNSEINTLMQDKSPTKRIEGVYISNKSVQEYPSKMVKVLLDVLTNDESSNVRLAAVQSLADHIQRSEVRVALINHLGIETDEFVKLEILNAISSKNDASTIKILENIADDDTQGKTLSIEAETKLFQLKNRQEI